MAFRLSPFYRPPPDLDNPERPPLDPGRVRRALDLHVVEVDAGRYHVEGPDGEDEYVELRPYFSCYCGDAVYRDSLCKHIIAALMAHGDPEAVGAARRLIAEEGR